MNQRIIKAARDADLSGIENIISTSFAAERSEEIITHLHSLIGNPDAVVFLHLTGKKISGLTCFNLLSWDTDFFGRRMGKIIHLIVPGENSDSAEIAGRLLAKALAEAEEKKMVHLRARLPEVPATPLRALEAAGFRLMEKGINLEFTFSGKLTRKKIPESTPPSFMLRDSRDEDLEELKAIAGVSFRKSFFYRDGFFDKKEIDRLHQVWVENLHREKNRVFLVAEIDGRLAGFAAASLKEKTKEARLELIAAAPEHRGKGLGSALLEEVLSLCRDRGGKIKLRTQVDNVEALRLYQKAGFKITYADATFCRQLK